MAFGVRAANSQKVLDDPKYVEWAPYLVKVTSVGEELETKYTPLSYRKCIEEDWK